MTDKRTAAGAKPAVKPKPAAKESSSLGLVPPSRTAAADAPAAPAAPTAARPKAPRPTARPPKPRFRLTRRATILVLALCAVVVTIAYPLQEYLAQSSQLNGVDQQNAQITKKVDQLQQQISLWSDPGYVAIQARAQLHYVKPGEEGFTLPGSTIGGEQLGMPTATVSPWYDTLWGTVKSPSTTPTGTSTSR